MLDPLSRQVFDAIRLAPDFQHFHEDDELLPGMTIRQLGPQLRTLVDLKLIVCTRVMPDSEPFNLIQIANPVKHPQTTIALRGNGILDI
jgi:hypothetical protein